MITAVGTGVGSFSSRVDEPGSHVLSLSQKSANPFSGFEVASGFGVDVSVLPIDDPARRMGFRSKVAVAFIAGFVVLSTFVLSASSFLSNSPRNSLFCKEGKSDAVALFSALCSVASRFAVLANSAAFCGLCSFASRPP